MPINSSTTRTHYQTFVNTTSVLPISTQATEPKIAAVPKSSPSIGKAGGKWVLITSTELILGIRVGGSWFWLGRSLGSFRKSTARFSASGQEQGYWRFGKAFFMIQDVSVCSRERRMWRAGEAVMRREKEIWRKEQSGQVGVLSQWVPPSLVGRYIPSGISGHWGLRWTWHIFVNLQVYSIIWGAVAQGYFKNRDIGSSIWHCLPW